MKLRNLSSMITAIAAVAAVAAVAAGAAAVALNAPTTSADPAAPALPVHAAKSDFISALDHQGIDYPGVADMIDIGKALCHTLRTGSSLGSLNNALAREGWSSAHQQAVIVVAAMNSICPDVWPLLESQVQQQLQASTAARW